MASLLIHPDTGTLLAAAWYGHIYRSTDDGATWTRVTFVGSGRIGERSLVVDPHTGQLFLIVKGWLFHSVNVGQTWGRFAFSPGNVAAFTIDENGDFFVGTSGDGVFRSTDGGQTWEAASTGLPPYPFDISEPYYKSHLGVRTLAVTPEGHLLTGMRDGGVYRSTNKGATWHMKTIFRS